jgi:hypothetical protein
MEPYQLLAFSRQLSAFSKSKNPATTKKAHANFQVEFLQLSLLG